MKLLKSSKSVSASESISPFWILYLPARILLVRDDSTDNFELFVHKKYRTYTNLSPWLFYNGGLASLVGNSAAAMSSNSITSTASQQQWLHVDFILCRCCTQPSTQKKIYMVGYSRSILNQIVKKKTDYGNLLLWPSTLRTIQLANKTSHQLVLRNFPAN